MIKAAKLLYGNSLANYHFIDWCSRHEVFGISDLDKIELEEYKITLEKRPEFRDLAFEQIS
jgi:hypothetical protein